jgi:hypothetical protein
MRAGERGFEEKAVHEDLSHTRSSFAFSNEATSLSRE